MTSTTIAIKRPNSVQINTPPRDRRVMPSESSKIGQSLLFVLFQYFPNKNCQLKHFRGIEVFVLLLGTCILNNHRILCTRKFFKVKLFLQTQDRSTQLLVKVTPLLYGNCIWLFSQRISNLSKIAVIVIFISYLRKITSIAN